MLQTVAAKSVCFPTQLRGRRRVAREVLVGGVGLGGANPVRIQSMLACATWDVAAARGEIRALAQAGAPSLACHMRAKASPPHRG